MIISDVDEALIALDTIGFYRLRGYTCSFYNNSQKAYDQNLSFHRIMQIYQFDQELSHCIFGMLSKIEVSLRSRITDTLVNHYQDALILYDPAAFKDKALFWKNLATISSEISRSKDIFITHNFNKHNGYIPIWAAVEVLSLGTISKIIKNLVTGNGSAYDKFATHYSFITKKGNKVTPSLKALSSWIQTITALRNRCAHNARIYNRSINTVPELLISDRTSYSKQRYAGIYQAVLAMKYLRPDNSSWNNFVKELERLLELYKNDIELSKLNFPSDWKNHLIVS